MIYNITHVVCYQCAMILNLSNEASSGLAVTISSSPFSSAFPLLRLSCQMKLSSFTLLLKKSHQQKLSQKAQTVHVVQGKYSPTIQQAITFLTKCPEIKIRNHTFCTRKKTSGWNLFLFISCQMRSTVCAKAMEIYIYLQSWKRLFVFSHS